MSNSNLLHHFSGGKYGIVFLFMLLIFPVSSAFADSGVPMTVSGKVTCVLSDGETEPLIGASVLLKGSNIGTATDAEGNYTINASKGAVLTFSYIGYKSKDVKVTKSTINVVMESDQTLLDDVVVVGYGTMKRSDLTGSVVSISEKDIKKSVITSVDQALQGRAAGVDVTQNSGSPGGGISVSIRGLNSLNGNEPLYIIDGIAIDGQTNGNRTALSTINPNDIVQMEVLKDASATAIYGSRGANGVIIITTRQGEIGKPKITYEGYYALQQIPSRLDVMNLQEYAIMFNRRCEEIGWGEREEFLDPSILGEGTNWQKEIFRNAPMHSHQVTMSGGTSTTRYMASAGYLNQEGIAVGSDFSRFSGRINLDSKITNWLQVGVQSMFAHTNRTNTIDNNSVISLALRQFPEVPARNPDGSWGMKQDDLTGSEVDNPLANALTRENYDKGLQVIANAWANFSYKGFSLRLEYGGSYDYSNNYYFVPNLEYNTYTQKSSGSRSASNSNYWSFKQYLTYDNSFERHSIQAMIGHEAQGSGWGYLSGSRENFLFNSVHELGVGDEKTAKNSSSKGSWGSESYYGRVNYIFDDRYLITATLRADGSANFGPANRWGWFPSAAVAWRFKNEAFLRDVEWLSNAKLRLGWGIVGNQNIGSYAYGSTMATISSGFGTSFYPANYANSKVKWERTKSYNVGLDLAFLNNRIEFIIDGYFKKTDNMLMQASLPNYVTGAISSPYVNTGAMQNKGFEFTLNTVNIDTRDFTWTSGLTFTLNRNKVTDLYTETAGIAGYIGNQIYTYTQVGYPAGQFYGYQVIGMFEKESDFYLKDSAGEFVLNENGEKQFVPMPSINNGVNEYGIWYGDYIFKDANEDGVIDEKDRVYIGNPEPKFTFGFNNQFSWKGIELNLFFTGSVGNKVLNYLRKEQSNPYNRFVTLKSVTDFARVEKIDPEGEKTLENMHVANPGSYTYRISSYNNNDNDRISNVFIEDGSYLRLKNLSVGYSFPKKLLKKIKFENLRVYMNIQNLCTITGYKGYDPEVGAYNQGVLLRGIDYARYPLQRVYTFGLNLTL